MDAMDSGYEPSDMTGFSDSEGSDNLDLMTSILKNCKTKPSEPTQRKPSEPTQRKPSEPTQRKPSEPTQRTMPSETTRREEELLNLATQNKEMDMTLMYERMKRMEDELHLLRSKVSQKESLSQAASEPPHTITRPQLSAAVVHPANAGRRCSLPVVARGARTATAGSNRGRNLRKILTEGGTSSKVISQRQNDKMAAMTTEKYSGLRIKNPLISSEKMMLRMEGRRAISVRNVASEVKNGDVPGDWVLLGVVVDKLPPRDTVQGKKFAIWKLSDLSSQTAVISLFLFGAAFQSHWKTSLGTVIAVLNPALLPNKEASPACKEKKLGIGLSIQNAMMMMVMGVSQDYTLCKASTKSGRKCSNFANTSDGGFCDYHVCHAYCSSRSNRMEFQSGYGPSTNRGSLKEKLFERSKTEFFYYGGQTYSVPPNSQSARKGGMARIKESARLFAPGSKSSVTKVMTDLMIPTNSTMSCGAPMLPGGATVTTCSGSEAFQELIKCDSLSRGARMFTEHTKLKETLASEAKKQSKTPEKTALEMLAEYQLPIPCLDKGSEPGCLIDLSPGSIKPTSVAKLKALNIIRKKREESTLSGRQKILKRVHDSQRGCEEEGPGGEEPGKAVKRARSSLDLDKLMNAKSSHHWCNEEADLEREREYFDRLEKKESIELKKLSVMALTVSVVHCKKCNYTAESPGKLCNKENHHLSRFKATKKAFVCTECEQKTFLYNVRWPVIPCSKCGASKYKPSSLYYERKGPTLPTEQLLLRGVEEKFLS